MSTTGSLTPEEWELLCSLSEGEVICQELIEAGAAQITKYVFTNEARTDKFCRVVNTRNQERLCRSYRCNTCLDGTGYHFTSKPRKLFIPMPRFESRGSQNGRRLDYSGQGRNRNRACSTKTRRRRR